MHDVPRTARRAAIVLVWFVLTGAAVAQGPFAESLAGDERGAALVAAIQSALSPEGYEDRVVEAVAAIRSALHRIVTNAADAEPPDEDDVCAYLVGTGGTRPRLDGGGDLLSVRGQELPEVGAIARSTFRIDGFFDKAAIVIVDDFNLEAVAVSISTRIDRLGSVVVDETTEANDLWTAVVGYRFDLQEEPDPESAFVPHGHLVAFHALSLLPQTSRITAVSMPTDDHVVLTVVYEPDSATTGVLTVHLLDIDFDDLVTIRNAMDESGQLGAATVVLSWGLVDCFLSRAYEEAGTNSTLAEYVAEALRGNPDVERLVVELCDAIASTFGAELLGTSCESGDIATIAVLGPLAYFAGLNERTAAAIDLPELVGQSYFAAAGNQGLGFPMPPAAWLGIHAVEACVLNAASPPEAMRAWFSNLGATSEGDGVAVPVTALGAWFETVEVRKGETEVLGYWGTSFAAPAAAVQFLESGLPADGRYAPCRGD